MAFKENMFKRNGIPVPIQALIISSNTKKPKKTLHYHDYFELLYGICGKSIVCLGTKEYSFCEGDLILVRSGEFHDATPDMGGGAYIVVKFLPSVLFAEGHTFSEYSYIRLLLQNNESKFFFTKAELSNTPIPIILPRIFSEWEAGDFGYELSMRADVTQTMLHVMRIWQKENPSLVRPPVTEAQEKLIQRALSHIDTRYADVTEEETALALGVSPAYLSRIFKKGMGTSFTAYATGLKLKEAERLLLGSDTSVTEIAEHVGFSTVAYFIASFRARYGITPAKYRKLLRDKQA